MTDTPVYTDEALRARFHELTAQREAILAESMPLREARDAQINELLAEVKASRETYDERIRTAEEGLAAIDQERANLVRALKGKTGPAPEAG